MIVHQQLTGYAASVRNIVYVSIWNPAFNTSGSLRFFPEDFSTIVDLEYDEDNDVTLYTYPHNEVNKVNILAERYISELEKLLQESWEKNPRPVTVNLTENGPIVIKNADFKNYYPSSDPSKDSMFRIETAGDDFSPIYVYKALGGMHARSLDILAQSSHISAPPLEKITKQGKCFFYMLAVSKARGKFTNEIPKDVDILHFPTRLGAEVPSFFNTTELRRILEGTDDSLINKDGTWEYTGKKKPEKKPEPETIVIHVPAPAENLEDQMVEDALAKNSVDLSDVINYGFANTLKLLGHTSVPVQIITNVPNLVKRMCVFEGFFYVIPHSYEDDFEEIFGEPCDMFIFCTSDEAYPVR